MRKYILTEAERAILEKRFAGEKLSSYEHVKLSQLKKMVKTAAVMARIRLDLNLLEKLGEE